MKHVADVSDRMHFILRDGRNGLEKKRLRGKILFIEAEQGLGDMIQFCRYAKRAADLGAHVVLTARQCQLRLLRGLDPRIEIRPER